MIDPQTLDPWLCRQIDETFELGDALPVSVRGIDYDFKQKWNQYLAKFHGVEYEIALRFNIQFGDISDMLVEWQDDPMTRFVLWCNAGGES